MGMDIKQQEELTKKEQYWIKYYDSVKTGYNETDAINKCGGNTYQSKTKEEMEVIREKIRQTKIEEKNPNARSIKRIDIETGEEKVFGSVIACARDLGLIGKTSIAERLNGHLKKPFKNKYIFEYYDE